MWLTSSWSQKNILYHAEIVLSLTCGEMTLLKLLESINIFLHSGFFKSWKYYTRKNFFWTGKEEVQRVPILGQNQTFVLTAWKPEALTAWLHNEMATVKLLSRRRQTDGKSHKSLRDIIGKLLITCTLDACEQTSHMLPVLCSTVCRGEIHPIANSKIMH